MLPFLSAFQGANNPRVHPSASGSVLNTICSTGWGFVVFLVISLVLGKITTDNAIATEMKALHAKVTEELSRLNSQISSPRNDLDKVTFFTEKLATNEEKLYQLQMDFQFHQENVEELDQQLTEIFSEHQRNLEALTQRINGVSLMHEKLTTLLEALEGVHVVIDDTKATSKSNTQDIAQMRILLNQLATVVGRLAKDPPAAGEVGNIIPNLESKEN